MGAFILGAQGFLGSVVFLSVTYFTPPSTTYPFITRLFSAFWSWDYTRVLAKTSEKLMLSSPVVCSFHNLSIGHMSYINPLTGGTAGCIVAGRLAEADPNLSILVIERGPDN